MPLCPKHRIVYRMDKECFICVQRGIISIRSEFDKQDRIIDTMRYAGNDFLPNESYTVLIFKKGKGY